MKYVPAVLNSIWPKTMTLVECNAASRSSNFISALRSTVVWSGAMSRTLSVNWPMPAVQRLKTHSRRGNDRQLRHADEVDDADEEKIAVGFLADFLAQQRGLQIGENSGGLHNFIIVIR